jgi:Domain of unknown function (DUF222)
MLAASQCEPCEPFLSVAVDTLLRMGIDVLERGERVHPDALDDVTMLEHLASAEPGPFSMMVLESIDPSTLDSDGRLAYVKAWDRLQRSIAARVQHALAGVLVADLPDDDDLIALEMSQRCDMAAVTMQWPPGTAFGRLDQALRIVTELPGTFALLSAGEISLRHAELIADATIGFESSDMLLVEARVLEKSVGQTPAEFGRAARRAAAAVAPHIAEQKHEAAVAGRCVRRRPGRDYMVDVVATLPPVDAETVYLALDAVARKSLAADGDKSIGVDARRADALLGWAVAALADPSLPKLQGRPVELHVVTDLPTMLGLAENLAELLGYGTIPASVARILSGDANWRRLIIDPVTGHLLDFGHRVYRPPQELRNFLIARDKVCRFPGCSMASERCDQDHGCPYDKGGDTSSCNCHCLCRRHHILKTTGGWKLKCHGDGSLTWISPGGTQFFVPAEDHRPTR